MIAGSSTRKRSRRRIAGIREQARALRLLLRVEFLERLAIQHHFAARFAILGLVLLIAGVSHGWSAHFP